jgi:hypothetical protein
VPCVHPVVGGDIKRVAARAREGIETSMNLQNVLWLDGRPHRAAAEYLLISQPVDQVLEQSARKGWRE